MERTEVNFSSNFPKLAVGNKTLFLGSCFSENIGRKFESIHLDTLVNPFGVLFHPMALSRVIKRAINEEFYNKSDFFEFQDYWFCYELSGKCAQFELDETVEYANSKLIQLKNYLAEVDFLFLTFGSAVERRNGGEVVANCHKQPSSQFEKGITSVETLFFDFEEIIKLIQDCNPNIQVYLTVSPVRHIKEGVVENQLSKSTLILFSHRLLSSFPNVSYLPIYEYVIDELRDYSFFKDDLVHPNEKAVEFVWQKITQHLFSEELVCYEKEASKIIQSINHKSLYPKSSQNVKFLMTILDQLSNLENKFSVEWGPEKETVNSRLKELA